MVEYSASTLCSTLIDSKFVLVHMIVDDDQTTMILLYLNI